MTNVKPPSIDDKAWQNSSAGPIQMCVLHQVNPSNTEGALANFVIGGVSVCVDHLSDVINLLQTKDTFWINDAVDMLLGEEMEE